MSCPSNLYTHPYTKTRMERDKKEAGGEEGLPLAPLQVHLGDPVHRWLSQFGKTLHHPSTGCIFQGAG